MSGSSAREGQIQDSGSGACCVVQDPHMKTLEEMLESPQDVSEPILSEAKESASCGPLCSCQWFKRS